jgi:hypothetical protein
MSMSIADIFSKIVLPLLQTIFESLSQNGAKEYSELNSPTSKETKDFFDGFNKSVKELKLYSGDQKLFSKLNDIPEVTDSDSAKKAASIFRDLAIDFKYNADYPGLSDVFTKQSETLDKAAVNYSATH